MVGRRWSHSDALVKGVLREDCIHEVWCSRPFTFTFNTYARIICEYNFFIRMPNIWKQVVTKQAPRNQWPLTRHNEAYVNRLDHSMVVITDRHT